MKQTWNANSSIFQIVWVYALIVCEPLAGSISSSDSSAIRESSFKLVAVNRDKLIVRLPDEFCSLSLKIPTNASACLRRITCHSKVKTEAGMKKNKIPFHRKYLWVKSQQTGVRPIVFECNWRFCLCSHCLVLHLSRPLQKKELEKMGDGMGMGTLA